MPLQAWRCNWQFGNRLRDLKICRLRCQIADLSLPKRRLLPGWQDRLKRLKAGSTQDSPSRVPEGRPFRAGEGTLRNPLRVCGRDSPKGERCRIGKDAIVRSSSYVTCRFQPGPDQRGLRPDQLDATQRSADRVPNVYRAADCVDADFGRRAGHARSG